MTSWDSYAPFYDWENARTLGRRDLPFWKRVLAKHGGHALELGCGTGRLLAPLARSGVTLTGVDLSEQMLARARVRARRLPRAARPGIVRGDIRALPFRRRQFDAVLAPYGMLQSLCQKGNRGRGTDHRRRRPRTGVMFANAAYPRSSPRSLRMDAI